MWEGGLLIFICLDEMVVKMMYLSIFCKFIYGQQTINKPNGGKIKLTNCDVLKMFQQNTGNPVKSFGGVR